MNEKELRMVIVSPEKTIFNGTVNWADFPGEAGRFQVLLNHAAIISSLSAGEIKYQCRETQPGADRDIQTLSIESGFVEVKHNLISVCVEL